MSRAESLLSELTSAQTLLGSLKTEAPWLFTATGGVRKTKQHVQSFASLQSQSSSVKDVTQLTHSNSGPHSQAPHTGDAQAVTLPVHALSAMRDTRLLLGHLDIETDTGTSSLITVI